MKQLHAYFCSGPFPEDTGGLVVIDYTFREAKQRFWRAASSDIVEEYIDIRGRRLAIAVPESYTEPTIITDCVAWCEAYGYGEACQGCEHERVKYRECYGDDEEPTP